MSVITFLMLLFAMFGIVLFIVDGLIEQTWYWSDIRRLRRRNTKFLHQRQFELELMGYSQDEAIRKASQEIKMENQKMIQYLEQSGMDI